MLALNAAVVLANYFQFHRGQRVSNTRVQSRMLLWCKSGYGSVKVNGTTHTFAPDDLLFLPWEHAIAYEADNSQPFLVAGIHIVPDYAPGTAFALSVPHSAHDRLANCPWRKDCELPGLAGIVKGSLLAHGPLAHLAEYIVESYCAGHTEEWRLRLMARLLLAELCAAPARGPHLLASPAHLQALLRYIGANLRKKLTLPELARHSGYSAATLARLFRKHVKMTPVQWIIHSRMEQAARLLATTPLSVEAVGREVGIEDPYYFSKLFKKAKGLTATAYRRKARLL